MFTHRATDGPRLGGRWQVRAQARGRGFSDAKALDGSRGQAARHGHQHGGIQKHEMHQRLMSQMNLPQKWCKIRAQLNMETRRAPQGEPEPERSRNGASPKHNSVLCTKRLVSGGLVDPIQLPNSAPIPSCADRGALMYLSPGWVQPARGAVSLRLPRCSRAPRQREHRRLNNLPRNLKATEEVCLQDQHNPSLSLRPELRGSSQGCSTREGSSGHAIRAGLPWPDTVLRSFLYDHLRGAAAEVSGKVTSLPCPAVTQPLTIQ